MTSQYYQKGGYAVKQIQATGEVNRNGNVGVWQHFHPNGTLAASGPWLNDEQHGEWQGFYDHGSLEYQGSYTHGLRQGWWTYFHPNGQAKLKGRYQQDRQIETWQRWDEQGTELESISFDAQGRLLVSTAQPDVGPAASPAQSTASTSTLPVEPSQPLSDVAGSTEDSLEQLMAHPDKSQSISPSPTIPGAFSVKELERVDTVIELYTSGVVAETGGFYQASQEKPTFSSNRLDLVGMKLPVDRLLGHDGKVIDLMSYRGKRVFLVMLRGFAGQVCLYCSAQTRVITDMLDEFAQRDTAVLFVYPGPASSIRSFLSGVQAVGGDAGAIPSIGPRCQYTLG